jgi:hypothetical protein
MVPFIVHTARQGRNKGISISRRAAQSCLHLLKDLLDKREVGHNPCELNLSIDDDLCTLRSCLRAPLPLLTCEHPTLRVPLDPMSD